MSKNNYPPVWVSQNFLTSAKTINRLIRKTSISASDHVIEIGPGKGHITKALLQNAKKVSAIELDKALFNKLSAKYESANNLKLYHQDFLKWKLPTTGPYKVFANIPFSHTTNIIRKLTEAANPPQEAWLTMEKSAAKRFMGLPRESAQSLIIKPLFEMRVIYHFLREDFHPMPGTDVVLLHIKKKVPGDISQAEWRYYKNFIATATKNNGLAKLFTKNQLSKAMSLAGVNDRHSGEILYIQWLCLFRCHRQYAAR